MTKTISRDRVIAAAVTLFARAGFNGVTTKEIAQSADVSGGNIYRYFPTKRDLFLCALESELQKLSVRAQQREPAMIAADSRTALRAVVKTITTTMVTQPDLVRLLHFSALEFKCDTEPIFQRHVYPIFEALVRHRQKCSCGACDIGQMSTFLFFIATVILLQDVIPSFSGYPSPFGSIESAATAYADLWCQGISMTPKASSASG